MTNDAQEAAFEAMVRAAAEARQHAYAPYSRFRVGAALLLTDGAIVSGANVENCSYGLTLCAERAAVVRAVAQGMRPRDIVAIAVSTEGREPAAPCGACRQVLSEFAGPSVLVIMHNVRDDVRWQMSMQELLPRAFTTESLPP